MGYTNKMAFRGGIIRGKNGRSVPRLAHKKMPGAMSRHRSILAGFIYGVIVSVQSPGLGVLKTAVTVNCEQPLVQVALPSVVTQPELNAGNAQVPSLICIWLPMVHGKTGDTEVQL